MASFAQHVWRSKMWFDERNAQKALDLIPTVDGIDLWHFWDDNVYCVIISATESVKLREVLGTLRKAFPITPIYTGYCHGNDLTQMRWAALDHA